MFSVAEALAQVLARARPLAPVAQPIAESLGLVLAEDVTSDVDSPPHDKSLVDGYAVVAADLASGTAELDIVEEVTAGSVPAQLVATGCATRIMTGAPIPSGADAVVMIERTESLPGDNLGRVRITSDRAAPGQNIMRRAASMSRGQTVLAAGSIVRAIEIGLLAEVGRSEVRVVDRPTVAVLATGNELVSHAQVPAAGQIRNSNGPLLAAAATAAGAVAVELGIARDERETLRARIGAALTQDIVAISGGVSAGVLDLVPGVLAELGVEQVFHKVNLKPGKPLWFGTSSPSPLTGEGRGEGESSTTGPTTRHPALVFGLPGNPVSSLVCFELFVRPAISVLAGRGGMGLETVSARLAADYTVRGDRPTYHPARLTESDGHWIVEPLRWHGSGDLRTLVEATALAIFEPGARTYRVGETVAVLRLS